MSLRARLRGHTSPQHAALDEALRIGKPDVTRADYVDYLAAMWRFHAPLEERLMASGPLARVVDDLQERRRAHTARADLRALSARSWRLEAAPPPLPPIDRLGGQLGVLYVLEGSTLGGAVLARRLRSRLDLGPGAVRYLSAYGDRTGARWRRFVDALDAARLTEDERRDAEEGARGAFRCVSGWLARTPPQPESLDELATA